MNYTGKESSVGGGSEREKREMAPALGFKRAQRDFWACQRLRELGHVDGRVPRHEKQRESGQMAHGGDEASWLLAVL